MAQIFLPVGGPLVDKAQRATDAMWGWMRQITAAVGGSGGGAVAPADAQYVTYGADATLTNERVATSSATITVNTGTAGQIKWDAVNTGNVTTSATLTAGKTIIGNGGVDVTVSSLTATVVNSSSGTLGTATPGTDYANLAFKTISVSGQSDIVADSAADTLTVAAGTGITITTTAGTDTLTIASSGSGSSGTLIGLERLLGDGATTTFNLPDVAEYVFSVTNAGLTVDPTLYTLASDGTSVTFAAAPTAANVLTFQYVILQS